MSSQTAVAAQSILDGILSLPLAASLGHLVLHHPGLNDYFLNMQDTNESFYTIQASRSRSWFVMVSKLCISEMRRN